MVGLGGGAGRRYTLEILTRQTHRLDYFSILMTAIQSLVETVSKSKSLQLQQVISPAC